MSAKINRIQQGSLADKHGLKAGDEILEINGRAVIDYLDYMYLSANERVEIKLADRMVKIKNDDFEPLGIEFETLLIDKPKSCMNKCIFCFIDQLPPNMRESCYFKDDDYRLSFLQGNYVTLTNMKDEELDRIIEYNLPRINVSVHTTNPELRKKMLSNKNAGKILQQLKRFADGGMTVNCQIVLCRDWNDGAELDRTIGDLGNLSECIESLSIVPVGISAYRDGLTEMKAFDKESSAEVIRQVSVWQEKFRKELGFNFVYLADEFYIMAGEKIPPAEYYDGFPQIENGVGLCSSLEGEFSDALEDCESTEVATKKSVATGVLAYDFLCGLVNRLDGCDKVGVFKIKNNFFGERITVSGLVTGGDIANQLADEDLGEQLLLPQSMLRHGEEVFLDNMTLTELSEALGVEVVVVENDGYELLEALLK